MTRARRLSWLTWLVLVFAFSLALRLAYLQGGLLAGERGQTPIYGDAAGYFLAGAALVNGSADAAKIPHLHHTTAIKLEDRRGAMRMMATRGPGYPVFLAVAGQGPI